MGSSACAGTPHFFWQVLVLSGLVLGFQAFPCLSPAPPCIPPATPCHEENSQMCNDMYLMTLSESVWNEHVLPRAKCFLNVLGLSAVSSRQGRFHKSKTGGATLCTIAANFASLRNTRSLSSPSLGDSDASVRTTLLPKAVVDWTSKSTKKNEGALAAIWAQGIGRSRIRWFPSRRMRMSFLAKQWGQSHEPLCKLWNGRDNTIAHPCSLQNTAENITKQLLMLGSTKFGFCAMLQNNVCQLIWGIMRKQNRKTKEPQISASMVWDNGHCCRQASSHTSAAAP